jgi:hypothetical protein
VDHSIERRTFRRFRIALPVLFSWADSVEHYDVGHCGVVAEFVLPASDLVRHPVRLRYVGRVSRVEKCSSIDSG